VEAANFSFSFFHGSLYSYLENLIFDRDPPICGAACRIRDLGFWVIAQLSVYLSNGSDTNHLCVVLTSFAAHCVELVRLIKNIADGTFSYSPH